MNLIWPIKVKKKQKDQLYKANIPFINYSDEMELIFIHIPKNAGTSIARGLGFSSTSHHTVEEIRHQLKDKFQVYYKIAFVRNPWDRFLSLYNYARLKESQYHSSIHPEKALYGKHLDYDLLINSSLKQCAHYLHEGKLKHDKVWNHWTPQVTWLRDESGKILVDHIGYVEQLDKEILALEKKLGKLLDIPKINTSRNHSKSYREYFDSDSLELVSDFYKEDIEAFNYRF